MATEEESLQLSGLLTIFARLVAGLQRQIQDPESSIFEIDRFNG